MKNVLLSLFVALFLVPSDVWAAVSCSRANLTRCLDSVCAINISSNPAARCQYCGTPSAGAPSATGMRGVSVGASAKYNISDKELKVLFNNVIEKDLQCEHLFEEATNYIFEKLYGKKIIISILT